MRLYIEATHQQVARSVTIPNNNLFYLGNTPHSINHTI